jgi:hydrogenase-1 operon protein HyaF
MPMAAFPIPVRAIGPGSQPPEDAGLDVMPMPHDMSTFEMPRVPERVPAEVMRESASVIDRMIDALARWDSARPGPGPSVPLDGLSSAALEVTNQVLGEGEVAIRLGGDPAMRIQESVFTGLWRCGELSADGRLVRYWLEAGSVPQAVMQQAALATAQVRDPEPWPAGAMNAPALLAELRARLAAFGANGRGGQINLTLLPLSPDDRQVIDAALPIGPVAIMSRGFGHCHVGSTAVPGVWRVQFFNSMNTLILDTIEITEMPEAVTASPEDLDDSRQRLAELVQWMREAAADELAH